MKSILILVIPLFIIVSACENHSAQAQKAPMVPDPSMELGQLASFHGFDPDRSFVIVGYRDELESETSKVWNDQAYLVFLYTNDEQEINEAVIHRNSLLKKQPKHKI